MKELIQLINAFSDDAGKSKGAANKNKLMQQNKIVSQMDALIHGLQADGKKDIICVTSAHEVVLPTDVNYFLNKNMGELRLKQKIIENNAKLNMEAQTFKDKYSKDEKFRTDLERIKEDKPLEYKSIMTKIEHPELQMATEYYYDLFKNIEGELHIIGMSPNNDAHIFDAILANPKLEKVIFYYMNPKEKEFVEQNYPEDLFTCESITEKWRKLGCLAPTFHCNYPMHKDVESFVKVANEMSKFEVPVKKAIQEVNKIPKYEMVRLCKLVKADMLAKNPKNESTDAEQA